MSEHLSITHTNIHIYNHVYKVFFKYMNRDVLSLKNK